MSGLQIQSEVAAALAEAGTETGAGPLVAMLTAVTIGGNPSDAPVADPDPVPVTIILDQWTRGDMDRLQIQTGDKKALMQATGSVPKTGDTLAINGRGHRIESVEAIAPGGVALLYTCHCRETGA